MRFGAWLEVILPSNFRFAVWVGDALIPHFHPLRSSPTIYTKFKIYTIYGILSHKTFAITPNMVIVSQKSPKMSLSLVCGWRRFLH